MWPVILRYVTTEKIFPDRIDIYMITLISFESRNHFLAFSLEDHCSVEQQCKMAEIFIHELGVMLLTEDDVMRIIDQGSPDKNLIDMDILPSPEQLKGKIILKVTDY